MRKLPFLLFILISFGYLLQSCSESDCPLTTAALGHFDFIDSKTHSSVSLKSGITVTGFITRDVTVRDTLEDGSIKEWVVKDSVISDTLYNSPTTSMSLPLSYTSKTTYVIHYTALMRDTITLDYKSIPYLDNIECGTMMFYNVNSVKYTTNVLDSVVIVNPDINNEEKRNFYIYYLAN